MLFQQKTENAKSASFTRVPQTLSKQDGNIKQLHQILHGDFGGIASCVPYRGKLLTASIFEVAQSVFGLLPFLYAPMLHADSVPKKILPDCVPIALPSAAPPKQTIELILCFFVDKALYFVYRSSKTLPVFGSIIYSIPSQLPTFALSPSRFKSRYGLLLYGLGFFLICHRI